MEDTASVALVLTTISTEEHAETLARQLLEERLIACSTVIGAASSHYWWGGAITSETEAVLLLKTRSDLVEQLRQRILELHPYNVPEVIVLQPSAVSDAYAAWVEEFTKPCQNLCNRSGMRHMSSPMSRQQVLTRSRTVSSRSAALSFAVV